MGDITTQGALWGRHPEDWADNEAMCLPLYEVVFDATGIGPGTRLLDLGCGAGMALAIAAERGAKVSGIDLSGGMVEYTRRRLPGEDVRQGDIQSLPYPEGAFDVVTAFNSIGFCDDQVAALREAKRVTAPGGRVGVLAWGDPARSEMGVLFKALGGLHPPAPQGQEVPPPATIEANMTAAGLTLLTDGEVELPLIWPDLAAAIRIQSSSGPAQLAYTHAGADATREALAAAFAGSRQPDGTYRMNNVFRYVVAAV